jgi:hypothetical protein
MSTNVVTISKEMYQKKLMLHSINFFLLRKSNKLTFLGRNVTSYELLLICYLILGVTVPLHLLVTAI